MKRKVFLSVILISFIAVSLSVSETTVRDDQLYIEDTIDRIVPEESQLYALLNISEVVGYEAFATAIQGYRNIDQKEREVLTLIDFTKPSTEERMVVIDMINHEVLCKSLVAHGRNSGERYATRFSNKNGSYMSSLGFYLTGATYNGSNGYSLKLYGLERGVNDMAYQRAIVMHGADYCDPMIVKKGRRLGRSLGCPALPREIAKQVIDIIKGGSVLFVYAEDNWYRSHSSILNKA